MTEDLCLLAIEGDRVVDRAVLTGSPVRLTASGAATGKGGGLRFLASGEDPSPGRVEVGTGEAEGPGRGRFRRSDGSDIRLAPGTHLRVPGGVLACLSLPRTSSHDVDRVLGAIADLLPALFGRGRSDDGEDSEALVPLLESLGRIFQADRAALVDLSGPGAPAVVRAQAGTSARGEPWTPSRSVLEAVAERPDRILAADSLRDAPLMAAPSLHQDVRSILACRLDPERPGAGCLYLESPLSERPYGEAEVRLLTSVRPIAAELANRAWESRELASENRRWRELQSRDLPDPDHLGLVGQSPGLQRVRSDLTRAARAGVTCLVLGETGTGKEVAARAIHRLSPRAGAPFVPVHCMALPRDLIESELFGHAKGAFSGAATDRIGRFEMAHGGTLLLDELGELSLEVQVKLLRVLEARTVTRLGESRERPVDVQLVAATNADLQALVASGRFREDLYYRLSVFVVRLPPLRERRDDLPELVDHFLSELVPRYRSPVRGLTTQALEALSAHSWPGNVRELRNVLEQAVVRCDRDRIGPQDLWPSPAPGRDRTPAPIAAAAPDAAVGEALEYPEAFARWEKAYLLAALDAAGGDVPRALSAMGMSRSNLYRKLATHGIDLDSLRARPAPPQPPRKV